MNSQHFLLEELKQAFQIIYVYYAHKCNNTILKSQKYIKLLKDAELIPNHISQKDADILYFKTTKNLQTLDYPGFQSILISLASLLYDYQPSQSIQTLYIQHFASLHQNIMNNSDFGKIFHINKQQIPIHFVPALQSILPILYKIYQYFFKIQHGNYPLFLQQYGIYPSLISSTQVQGKSTDKVIHQICQDKYNYNELFSFPHFIDSLIRVAILNSDDELESFLLLIQKLEESNGYKNYQKHYNQTQNCIMSKLVEDNLKKDKKKIQQKVQSHSTILQMYEKDLKSIFEQYTLIGEPLNRKCLKTIKFKKMLKDAQILNSLISQIDFDLICKKVADGKLQFMQFVNALQLISQQSNVELESLITNKLFILLKSNNKQNKILEQLALLLEDEDVLEMLPLMEDQFQVYFDKFANYSELMDWEQFYNFCLHFQMQSSYLSQTQLMDIFYALASIDDQEKIDVSKFIEALCLMGIHIFSNVDDMKMKVSQLIFYSLDQVVYFVEKLQNCKQEYLFKNTRIICRD